MHRFAVVALVLAVYGGWHWWSSERAVHRPPGIVAPDEPVQIDLDPPPRFEAKGYTFVKRAKFDITARLLRKETYHLDGGAGLAPVDLGLGWGLLSDSAMLEGLEFSQMGRFFYWQPRKADFPLPKSVLISHMAQMHVIPADKEVESRLKKLRPGQLVTASGYLVDVRGPGGFAWNTSLSRTDTGDGACELFWVEALEAD
jgi:hypothetical protein